MHWKKGGGSGGGEHRAPALWHFTSDSPLGSLMPSHWYTSAHLWYSMYTAASVGSIVGHRNGLLRLESTPPRRPGCALYCACCIVCGARCNLRRVRRHPLPWTDATPWPLPPPLFVRNHPHADPTERCAIDVCTGIGFGRTFHVTEMRLHRFLGVHLRDGPFSHIPVQRSLC